MALRTFLADLELSNFWINLESNGWQGRPSILALAEGGFIVSWTTFIDEDNRFSYVIYDQNGMPTISNVDLDAAIDPLESDNSFFQMSNGSLVKIWASNQQSDSKFQHLKNDYALFGVVQEIDGSILRTFEFGSQGSVDQINPTLAPLGSGMFVTVWEAPDGSGSGVFGQILDSDGVNQTDVFQVNSYTQDHQVGPTIAALKNGNIVVVWSSRSQDGDRSGVYAQVLDVAGGKLGPETRINSETFASQFNPAVTQLNDGGFAVAYVSENASDQWGTFTTGVYLKLFDVSGAQIDDEIRVNSSNIGNQREAKIAVLESGEFVVVWSSDSQSTDPGIFYQLFNSQGVKLGSEIKVDEEFASLGSSPDVEALRDGGFVIVWKSGLSDLGDIFGQRYSADGSAVSYINQAPVFLPSPVTSAIEDVEYVYEIRATDFDLIDRVSVEVIDLPSWLEFDRSTNSLSGVPSDPDVGLNAVSLMASDFYGQTVHQNFFINVLNVNDLPTGFIEVSGIAREGEALVVDVSSVSDGDGIDDTSVDFQWLRDGVAILDATSITYELTQDDVGAALSFVYSYTDNFGTPESVTSSETAYVASNGELITGTPDPDDLIGTVGSDTIQALGSDDTITATPGKDQIDGGAGADTVVYSGNQNSYSLTLSPTGTTIEDRRSDGNGIDTLSSIESLRFGFDLSESRFNLQLRGGGGGGLDAEDFESFIEFYIAYFNRAPDAEGLNFWGTAFANGVTLEEMARYFIDQDETRATYPDGTSNTDFVTAVYDNVLGRIPDQAGFDFWVDMLNRSDVTGVTRDQFILEVLRGVQDGSPDRAYLDTKVDIGAYFAVHRGMSDTDNASAAMALFDGTQGSVNAAVAAIDGYYQDALDPTSGEFLMQVVGVLDNPFA